jgi:hypothetical protein
MVRTHSLIVAAQEKIDWSLIQRGIVLRLDVLATDNYRYRVRSWLALRWPQNPALAFRTSAERLPGTIEGLGT